MIDIIDKKLELNSPPATVWQENLGSWQHELGELVECLDSV